jgi:predicted hydrocarbon binding protein
MAHPRIGQAGMRGPSGRGHPSAWLLFEAGLAGAGRGRRRHIASPVSQVSPAGLVLEGSRSHHCFSSRRGESYVTTAEPIGNDLREARATLQAAMSFLGAMAGGIEQAVGPTANSITYVAGKDLGRKFSADVPKTQDVESALDLVRQVLERNHCLWTYEAFKTTAQPDLVARSEGAEQIMLVFRDCMIRQSLFLYGHAQKGSLCNMMFGFFAGALETIMGCQSNLEIVHAGENACYKRLTVTRPIAAD